MLFNVYHVKCYSPKVVPTSEYFKHLSALWQTEDWSHGVPVLPNEEMGKAPAPSGISCGWKDDNNFQWYLVEWELCLVGVAVYACFIVIRILRVTIAAVKNVFSLPFATAHSWASKSTCPTWFWQKKSRSRSPWAVRLSRVGSPHFCCPLPFSCKIIKVTQRYGALMEHDYLFDCGR